MTKGWEHFSTVNDVKVEDKRSKQTRAKAATRMIRTVVTLSEDEMKKASNELYEARTIEEDNLIAAYDSKKLKSKRLIKQARNLKKLREEAAKKAAEAQEKGVKTKETIEVV